MRYLSVCSGIEAATVAWHQLGWTPEAYSEIEKFPAAVLAHHYPQTPNLGDMTNYKEWNIGDIDLLVGGTPCQSFSVAGLRKGLGDPRGNLALVYLGIAERFHPRWLLWENVPGVLSSSGGRDFGSFLGAMAQLGYGFAYRVLDAQYFGVPQRRRRVFVVGHLGDWRRAAAVLFESHSLQGHPAPSRKAGEGFTRGVEFGPSGGRFTSVNPTLDARAKDGPIRNQLAGAVACFQQNTRDEVITVVPALTASGVGTCGADDNQGQAGHLIPFVAEDVSATLKGGSGERGWNVDDGAALVCMSTGQASAEVGIGIGTTLNCNHEAPIVAFGVGENPDLGHCLRSGASKADKHESTTYIASPMQVRRLTPTECERLQGFPDGYTNIPWRNKPESPDGPRYKALGNSMCTNVMSWLGKRVDLVDKIV